MSGQKISIVTPSFNSAKFIDDCIKSVLSQEYSNYEHIIVDGNSKDGTLEIIKRYPHVKWVCEPDRGQSDALNKGFGMASGDIIGWLNSDDVYMENTFTKVADYFRDPTVDGIYSNYYFADERLNVTRSISTHRPIRWLALFHCFVPSATLFFKRKILESGIHMDRSKHLAMDKAFIADILFNDYNIVHVPDYFSKFRWHSGNKSIENRVTRRTRIREGVDIFNTHSSLAVPNNWLTQELYYLLDDHILKLVRIILKMNDLIK